MRKIAVFDIPDDALIASDARLDFIGPDSKQYILLSPLSDATAAPGMRCRDCLNWGTPDEGETCRWYDMSTPEWYCKDFEPKGGYTI